MRFTRSQSHPPRVRFSKNDQLFEPREVWFSNKYHILREKNLYQSMLTLTHPLWGKRTAQQKTHCNCSKEVPYLLELFSLNGFSLYFSTWQRGVTLETSPNVLFIEIAQKSFSHSLSQRKNKGLQDAQTEHVIGSCEVHGQTFQPEKPRQDRLCYHLLVASNPVICVASVSRTTLETNIGPVVLLVCLRCTGGTCNRIFQSAWPNLATRVTKTRPFMLSPTRGLCN